MIIDGHVHITDIPEPVWEWLPFTGDDLIALMNQNMPVRGCLDELRCDSHLLAGAHQRPLQDGVDAQLAGDLRQGLVMHSLVLHHRRSGNDVDGIDFCYRSDQLVRDPIGEIVLCRVSR